MRFEEAVALKKSKVFWISSSRFSFMACSTGTTSSNATLSTASPFLTRSAEPKGRLSSFCTASV